MDALVIKNLVKNYGNVQAVKDISVQIKKGEFFGFLGHNGAGKTTTINIITGLANKTSGIVKVFGHDVVTEYKQARSFIGLVPQEFNLDTFEKVYNIMRFNAGYFGLNKEIFEKRCYDILQAVGLWEKRFSKAITLSGGMKRKLMIARALLHHPKMLILDEPTAGVDVETRRFMWEYFRKLNREGITILLTTHYLEEAETLCERIAIMKEGKIATDESKDKLLHLLEGEQVIVTLQKEIVLPTSLHKYSAQLEGRTLRLLVKKEGWETLMPELSKLPVSHIEVKKNSLEDVFIHVTQQS